MAFADLYKKNCAELLAFARSQLPYMLGGSGIAFVLLSVIYVFQEPQRIRDNEQYIKNRQHGFFGETLVSVGEGKPVYNQCFSNRFGSWHHVYYLPRAAGDDAIPYRVTTAQLSSYQDRKDRQRWLLPKLNTDKMYVAYFPLDAHDDVSQGLDRIPCPGTKLPT
jgi:hypothetical protein